MSSEHGSANQVKISQQRSESITITLFVQALVQALEHSINPSPLHRAFSSIRELEGNSVIANSGIRERTRNVRDGSIHGSVNTPEMYVMEVFAQACLTKGYPNVTLGSKFNPPERYVTTALIRLQPLHYRGTRLHAIEAPCE